MENAELRIDRKNVLLEKIRSYGIIDFTSLGIEKNTHFDYQNRQG